MIEQPAKRRVSRRQTKIPDEIYCEAWNRLHPVGTVVNIRRADHSVTRTKVRSEAFVCERISHH